MPNRSQWFRDRLTRLCVNWRAHRRGSASSLDLVSMDCARPGRVFCYRPHSASTAVLKFNRSCIGGMVTKWSPTLQHQQVTADKAQHVKAQFAKQFSTRSHSLTLSGTTEVTFRVRCFQPLSQMWMERVEALWHAWWVASTRGPLRTLSP